MKVFCCILIQFKFFILINFLGAFLLEAWKRRNSELAYRWNVIKFESDEIDLPSYKERLKYLKKKLQNKSDFIKYLYSKENTFKTILSIMILMLMVRYLKTGIFALIAK